MANVRETVTIAAHPNEVWEIAGDPGRIADWVPAIATSAADGDERSCTLVDGAELVERILGRSDAQRYYDYEIVDAPMPVRFYRSRLSVTERDGIAQVDWTAEFEPQRPADEDRLVEAFAATYRGGLEALRDQVETRGAA